MPVTINGTTGISAPAASISTGSGQYATALVIDPSTHATSRRAAVYIGSWLLDQDTAGNGIKDFGIYDSTASATRLLIDASGNIGIGVTPTEKLHVAGNIKATGTVYGSGTPVQVVFKSFSDQSAKSSYQAYTDVTNGSLAITSKVANSKFLIRMVVQGYILSGNGINIGISRTISSSVTRLMGVDGASGDSWTGNGNGAGTNSWTIVREYLDSPSQPAGTSITYNMLYALWTAGTGYVNYSGYSTTSTISIMEITA